MTLEASYALAIFTLLVFVGGCFFGVWFHPTEDVESIVCPHCGRTVVLEEEDEEEGEDD